MRRWIIKHGKNSFVFIISDRERIFCSLDTHFLNPSLALHPLRDVFGMCMHIKTQSRHFPYSSSISMTEFLNASKSFDKLSSGSKRFFQKACVSECSNANSYERGYISFYESLIFIDGKLRF